MTTAIQVLLIITVLCAVCSLCGFAAKGFETYELMKRQRQFRDEEKVDDIW